MKRVVGTCVVFLLLLTGCPDLDSSGAELRGSCEASDACEADGDDISWSTGADAAPQEDATEQPSLDFVFGDPATFCPDCNGDYQYRPLGFTHPPTEMRADTWTLRSGNLGSLHAPQVLTGGDWKLATGDRR